MKDPEATLLRGVDLLRPLLSQAGFTFVTTGRGRGSGGEFATGEFKKGDRRLSLSYRHSLGEVTYSVGAATLTHDDYMWACGIPGQYPGFSTDELAPFEHLKADLTSAGDIFLSQSAAAFDRLVKKCRANPPKRGFGALGESR